MSVTRAERVGARLAPGVSHGLARWRARHYADVRYDVHAQLPAKLAALSASVVITVTLRRRCNIVLDWRAIGDARIDAIRVNGKPCRDARLANEHVIIGAHATCTGENVIALRVRTPIGAAGSALIRYRDRADGSNYVYTLCVPADARTLFPCFDQPDLKARFTFALTCPNGWQVIANAPPVHTRSVDARRQTISFAQTAPISTYLFAFAAGPFVALTEPSFRLGCRLYLRRSQADHAQPSVRTVLRLNRRAVDYFAEYTAHAFPFGKYDLVLIPEFAFNGMEHAGATFLREESVLLPAHASAIERARRANLILHETAHQWFGNLVTMRWFDDVWIKEAFANWLAARAAAALTPESNPWLAFAVLKASAIQTDATRGATPLRQSLGNLADAKSLYGTIIYGKGPALLRQLEHDIGVNTLRRAIRRLITLHAYGTIDTRDLMGAIAAATGRDWSVWTKVWITRPGLPRINVRATDGERANILDVIDAQPGARRRPPHRPQRFTVSLISARGSTRSLDVRMRSPRMQLAVGPACSAHAVLPNDGDFGYGVFMTGAGNLEALRAKLPYITDPLRRWLIWSMSWESVREMAVPPLVFLREALRWLPHEHEPLLLGALLDRIQIAFGRYCLEAQRGAIAAELEAVLRTGFAGRHARRDTSVRTGFRRAFISIASTLAAHTQLHMWVRGDDGGAPMLVADRFRCAQRLIIQDDSPAPPAMRALVRRASPGDRERLVFATGAAHRGAKQGIFAAFLDDPDLPESWIEETLTPFNATEHAAQTLPLLAPALRALPRLKREHKIFFVNRWLGAFIGGQCSSEALRVVRRELPRLPPDLRRKALEALGELVRTVRIRARFADMPDTRRR